MASPKVLPSGKGILTVSCGQSQTPNRFTSFASAAKKSGHARIFNIFPKISSQEIEQARRLFGFSIGCDVEIAASFPVRAIGDTG